MARGGMFDDITAYLCFNLFVATLGPFQFGFHLAELNAPQAVITCEKKSITASALHPKLPQCIPMNTDQFALISSVFTLGGLLGALLAGPWCSKWGRLSTMRMMTLFFVVGAICESLAPNMAVLAIGRVIAGVGTGMSLVVVPIYVSEISPPNGKGLFGAFTQIMINLGIFVTQLLGYFLSRDSMWRIILAVAGVIGMAQFLSLTLVPESPKWLAEHGHPQCAREILRKIRGRKADLEEEAKAWKVNAINADDIQEEESLLASSSPPLSAKHPQESVGILTAIYSPTYRPAIIAVVAVMTAQQLTGINSIVMYSVKTLSSLLPTTAALLTVALSALNLIMTTLCAPLSDKIGRKPCILLSIAGMGISSLLLASGIANGIKPLAATATLLFVASFAVGLGPVPFILANELVGPEAVGATQSWALAANWIATFIVSQFFPMLNQALGEQGGVYLVFAGCAAVLGGFIAWWVPETRGKRGLEEVWGRPGGGGRERLE